MWTHHNPTSLTVSPATTLIFRTQTVRGKNGARVTCRPIYPPFLTGWGFWEGYSIRIGRAKHAANDNRGTGGLACGNHSTLGEGRSCWYPLPDVLSKSDHLWHAISSLKWFTTADVTLMNKRRYRRWKYPEASQDLIIYLRKRLSSVASQWVSSPSSAIVGSGELSLLIDGSSHLN